MRRRTYLTVPILLLALIATGVAVALRLFPGCRMSNPTGRSSAVALPPMSDEEAQLAQGLRRHVEKLAGEIGERHVGAYDRLEAAADYIAATLGGAGYEVGAQEYKVSGRIVRNLDAEIRGSTRPAEILIVGAHYDSVPGCPAANDNGSGVAALLEMAWLLAHAKPARTVRFVAFVNEEPPYFQSAQMGSVVYARRCKARRENVVGMMSLETIGYYTDAPGSQQYPPPYDRQFPSTGNFIAFVANEESAAWVKDVTTSFKRHTPFPSEAAAAPEHVTGVGFSDQWSFWQEGYPALMVTDTAFFRYPHYHTPQDTPDKLDYDRTARVVTGLVRVVEDLAGIPPLQGR